MTPSSVSPQNKVAKHDFCQAAFKSLTVWPLQRYATQALPWKSDLWFQISQFEVNLFMFQAFNIKFVLKWFIKSVPGVFWDLAPWIIDSIIDCEPFRGRFLQKNPKYGVRRWKTKPEIMKNSADHDQAHSGRRLAWTFVRCCDENCCRQIS